VPWNTVKRIDYSIIRKTGFTSDFFYKLFPGKFKLNGI